MKKLLVLAAALLPFAGSSAWAAVAGTAHDHNYTNAQSGDCSVCHIPHAAKGNRLWPATPIGGANGGDKIGPFCAYCHKTGGGSTIAAANADSSVWSSGAHGFGTTTNPDGNTSNTSSLPYSSTAGSIQCTTCHNVHDDTNRPFLRVNQDALCQLCHPSRGNSSATWSGMGSANSTGSHPVGSNITGDITTPGDTPINATPLGIRVYGTAANYVLGPKAFGGGASIASGMVCQSCHSVHGVETVDGGAMVAGTPASGLLAIPQTAMSGHANGAQNSDARNALCEGCHYTTATTTTAKGTAYAGTFRPNPGGTAYTHPVDDLAANLNWVSSMPTTWPYATTVGTLGNAVLCESCHMPHPAASTVAQTSSPATVTNNTPILRDATATICDRCHTNSRPDHHPAGVAMGRYADTAIVPTGTTLNCSNCHGGAGAHNWTAPAQGSAAAPGGLGLNANWKPANNARGAADVVGQVSTDATNNLISRECIDCHTATTGGAGRERAPTNNAAASGDPLVTIHSGSTEYQDSGDGTHWIGINGTAGNGVTYSAGYIGGTFDATTTAWPVVANNSQGGWSRWGVTKGDVVCESCHELEPDKTATAAQADGTANAAGQSSLLLYWFTEGGTGADTNHGTQNATSQFCTGCHGQTPGGGTPHPMTGSTITKVVDSGIGATGATRTTTTLKTSNGGFAAQTDSYMNAAAATITSAFVTLPALDSMNCDSCHQVHDTPSNAGSWILDAGRAEITGGLAAAPWGASPATANYQAFCLDCHSY